LLACTLLLSALSAAGADIHRLDVERQEGLFRLYLSAHVRAPSAAVWSNLTHYACLHRLSEAVRLSEILGQDGPGNPLLYTRTHLCVWIFCKELEQVQRMRVTGSRRLEAESLPGLSDFEYGYMRWDLAEETAGTRFQLIAELRPAFWVPPVLGPLLIARGLRTYALDALHGLERESLLRP
jgi:hypothetical protein